MLERISKILGLSEGEVKRRIAYVNLSPEEVNFLRELSNKLSEEEIAKIFREFYKHLFSFEETKRILEREEDLLDRLKDAQIKYFRELLKAEHNLDYALSRLKVGMVHERVGVDPKFYTGAFAKWVETILPLIEKKVPKDKLLPTVLALFKAVVFDMTISLEAYLFAKVIRSSDPRYRAVLDAIKDALIVADLTTRRIVDLNRSTLRILGLKDEGEILGKDILWVYPKELKTVAEERLIGYLSGGGSLTEVEYLENKKTGERIPVEVVYGIFEEDSKRYLVGVFRDIRERLKKEEIIRRINRLYDTLSRINMLTTTSTSEEELLRTAVRILKEGGFSYAGIFRKGEETPLAEDGVRSEEDVSLCVPMENDLHLLVSRPYKEEFTKEEIELLREVAHDLSFGMKKLSMEERLARLELYDEVTHFPNRSHFLRKLSEIIDRAKRERKEVGVLLLDIDNFSELNEAFGHEKADTLLKEVAGRLKALVRESDLIGRVGVDEFGIAVISEDAKNALERLSERIKEAFGQPLRVDSQDVYITFSSGISIFPEDVDTGEKIFSNASYSLHRAKELGGNRTLFYSETKHETSIERVRLRSDMRKAIERKEFLLFYQPKVDLKTGKVVGAEALLRWKKEGNIIPPAKFIPVLEESELIYEVGLWTLEEACGQIRTWKSKGINIPIAINVSPAQLKIPSFLGDTLRVVSKCEGKCTALEFEITESAVMEDTDMIVDILNELNSAGIKTYIDDFGTGYASLIHLKKLPVYALKIDIEFVKDIPHDKDDLEIVKATVDLARTFGLKTVAEGVEREEQVKILREIGCDFGQGYYFGKPMPPEEFERLVLERQS